MKPASEPLLSTVVLSWNRVDLLRQTVASYLSTVSVAFELVIVDNASTDGAAEYARDVASGRDDCRAILLDANRGGEGWNAGLEGCSGEFLHTSCNDVEYLRGWDAQILQKFEIFPELGQLELISPFPRLEQGEIWETHPAEPATRGSCTIYRTEMNTGGLCIMPRRVWDLGFRWHNLVQAPGNPFLFPDDGRASREIRELGYWTAWNDTYVVRNVGHSIDEFVRRMGYYVDNYTAKGWFGLEGWKKRLNAHGYDLVTTAQGHKIVKL